MYFTSYIIVKANAVHSKPFKLGANCELSCIRGHIKRDSNHEIYMVGIRGTARPWDARFFGNEKTREAQIPATFVT